MAAKNVIAALHKEITQTAEKIVPVSLHEINQLQSNQQHSPGTKKDDDEIYMHDGHVWVPDSPSNLRLRIITSAHCEERGHRAYDAKMELVQQTYCWPGMKGDDKEFVQARIHCIVSRNNDRIPRPLATALQGEEPNEVEQTDFLHMPPSNKDNLT